MILVLCAVLALLAASSHAQDLSGTTLTSPCPGVFTYNPTESKPGSWSGVANLYSETLLLWVELSIVLDSPALGVFGKLEDWVRNATTHNNVKFTIDLDFQIYPDFPVTVFIFVQYDPNNKIPRLQTIRLNEKDICNADFKPDNNPSTALNPGPSLYTTPDTPIITYECGLVFGGNERLPLIYDGNFYGRGEIPWLVAIFREVPGNLLFICGGTLVSDRHVVSAAHCMQRPLAITPKEEILVMVGLHNLNYINDTSVVTRKLAASSIHEEYNPDTLQNDILIFTLEKSVKFTRYIRPACIWSGDTELSRVVGATGVVAGWGNRSERDTRGRLGEPQMVRIPIVSTKECRASKAAFHQLTYNTTLCAGDRNGAGPCRGDSGTGLYLLEEGRWRLRGVVSLSLQNTALTCDLNEYVVFTDTAQYLPWIRKILTEKDAETENRATFDSTACGLVAGGNDRVTLSMGKDNARGDVPWLVAIYVRNATTYSLRYLCAGTLVSNRHVIAAAHCMQRRSMETTETAIRDFVVKVGAHNVNDWTEDMTVTRKIVSIDINENYKINPLHYDILVLTLNKRIQFNNLISPACLWSGNTELSGVVGSSGIVASWGVLRDDFTGLHDKPEVMRATIVSTEECRASDAIFGIIVSDTTFCAGNRDGATSCLTDGAGLFLLEGGRWTLRGIGALGLRLTIETSSCRQYAMYTDIAKFLPWITSILSQKYVD